ncbi:hypothetical protein KSP39_PZI015551 [Platanthera zijinensis]|uniref:Uncharacterized protein n=1 Tax=Platanthera zijinensis TaxID=2320716 RepID=A0AAP0BBC0_9ASPA
MTVTGIRELLDRDGVAGGGGSWLGKGGDLGEVAAAPISPPYQLPVAIEPFKQQIFTFQPLYSSCPGSIQPPFSSLYLNCPSPLLRNPNSVPRSYQRADPNYVMLTPNKEHLAEGVLRDFGKRPMFESQINAGNYEQLPSELKPIGKIF